MRCLLMAALVVCAAPIATLRADEWLKGRPVVVHEEVHLIDHDFARQERARRWQAELAARELETQRAQTAWLPPARIGPIEENVVLDRPTFSNGLYAVNRPYAFVPEPYFVTPNADRRSFAYRWYPYVFTPATVAPPTYVQPNFVAGYPPASVQVVAPRAIPIRDTVPVTATRGTDIEIR